MVVTQAFLDFCNMKLFQGGICSENSWEEEFRETQNKFTKIRKILRENDRSKVDQSLSGNGALASYGQYI